MPQVGFSQPAYVLFTSGSTGRPKGVLQHSGGLCNRLLWMRDAFSVTREDRVLQKTPCTFDVSGWEIWLPLIAGGRCVLLPPGAHRDPAEVQDWIERHAVTLCHFVPSLFEEFLRGCPRTRAGRCGTSFAAVRRCRRPWPRGRTNCFRRVCTTCTGRPRRPST